MARIQRLLSNVSEADVRMRLLNRFVNEAPPVEVVQVIESAARRTDRLDARVLITSLAHLLMESRPRPSLEAGPFVQEPRREWPDAVCVAQLIVTATRVDATYTASLFRELWQLPDDSDARMLPPHISIEHLSLGVRRERARSPQRDVLLPLLVETHPSVVTLLAGNTRLRELDAVRLVALRPQHPYSLWAMLLRPRWLSSQSVLEGVALNPACQPWMLLAVAPLLPASVLRRALRSGRFGSAVVEAMRQLHRGALSATVDESLGRSQARSGPAVIEVEAGLEHGESSLKAALVAATDPAPQWQDVLPLRPPPPRHDDAVTLTASHLKTPDNEPLSSVTATAISADNLGAGEG